MVMPRLLAAAMARNNRTVVEEINQVASPSMGSRVPSGKQPDDRDDTIGRAGFYKPEKVRDAKNVPNAAQAALDKQGGRQNSSGGILGDNCTQPNSGFLDYDQYKVRTSYSPKSAKNYNSKTKP